VRWLLWRELEELSGAGNTEQNTARQQHTEVRDHVPRRSRQWRKATGSGQRSPSNAVSDQPGDRHADRDRERRHGQRQPDGHLGTKRVIAGRLGVINSHRHERQHRRDSTAARAGKIASVATMSVSDL
jgi:hypothetical protein